MIAQSVNFLRQICLLRKLRATDENRDHCDVALQCKFYFPEAPSFHAARVKGGGACQPASAFDLIPEAPESGGRHFGQWQVLARQQRPAAGIASRLHGERWRVMLAKLDLAATDASVVRLIPNGDLNLILHHTLRELAVEEAN